MRAEGVTAAFELDDNARWRLLEGLDDISLTLANEADIAAFESRRPSYKPSTVERPDPSRLAHGSAATRTRGGRFRVSRAAGDSRAG